MASAAEQLALGIAQLNANLRNMGDSSDQAINGFYKEVKRAVASFDTQRGLRYRPATINVSVPVLGAGTATGGSADFRVADNEDFVATEMRAYIVMNDLTNEPASPAALGATMTPLDRMIAKALNARVTLLNKDTKVPIMENEGISMANICPEAGGAAMIFGPRDVPGFIIPHNTTITVQVALQSINAFFNTASTNYGIALSGVYLSRDKR